jgi:acetyl-CoA carboxylase carboxyl transferase subunit alpha
MYNYLDFEKPVQDLELKILELKKLAENGEAVDVGDEISRLEKRSRDALRDAYKALTPWQKVQVARHVDRPHCVDYIKGLFTDFTPLAGDRNFGEDQAVVAGLARFRGRPIAFIGQEKGNDTQSRVKHNFGMAMPEGYRKAVRIFELADQFGLPVLSFCDTSGAYPGVSAEERGQAEAIARSIQAGLSVRAPFIATIIGEGMSGGAIAIAAASRVYMLEHAIYSVISPEGCASILWRDAAQAASAAEALRLTAEDLKRLALVDLVIPEPLGGAQRDAAATIAAVGDAVADALLPLVGLDGATLKARRREKFLNAGREGLA